MDQIFVKAILTEANSREAEQLWLWSEFPILVMEVAEKCKGGRGLAMWLGMNNIGLHR